MGCSSVTVRVMVRVRAGVNKKLAGGVVSGREGFGISPVGSGRVGSGGFRISWVGPGHAEVFQISRVGSGHPEVFKYHGSDRVTLKRSDRYTEKRSNP